jgi:alpha,alpha-trehalase
MTNVLANSPGLEIQPGLPAVPQCIDQIYPGLIEGAHASGEFAGMDMIDMVRMRPLRDPDEINIAFAEESARPGFSYKDFMTRNFDPPRRTEGECVRYRGGSLDDHEHDVLMAHVGVAVDGPSTIGSPNHVVESGGRYSDARPGSAQWYHWDTEPAVVALDELGEHQLAAGLVDNIRDQVVRFERRPFNGNSPEYVGRGQPNIYCRMVRRDVAREGVGAWERHLTPLLIEYHDMMDGADDPTKLGMAPGSRYKSVMRMPDGSVLNVFSAEGFTHIDGTPRPRPESYPADMRTKHEWETVLDRELTREEWTTLCENLHAGAGAGTDFADWMLGDGHNMYTIRTTRRVAPFQQALMFELECTIAEGLRATGDNANAELYEMRAAQRSQSVNRFLFNRRTGYYHVWDADTGLINDITVQDGSYMLESGMALTNRLPGVRRVLERRLLDKGGLRTSLKNSPQSWGGDNVWANLQLSAARGAHLSNDLHLEHAITRNFQANVREGLHQTGYSYERYHAAHLGKPGGRGEYAVPEHNFTWTAATDLAFRHHSYRREYERQAWTRRHRIAARAGSLAVR